MTNLAARLEPYARDLNVPVIHSSNAIDTVGNCHHLGKSCRRESLGLNLAKGNRPIGGTWKTTYPLDQVGRPEVAIRGRNGITINTIVTITPRIYKLQRCNFDHKQVSFRFFQNCNSALASKISCPLISSGQTWGKTSQFSNPQSRGLL